MSTTTMPNMKEIKRTWYILDAEGKSLGRVAAQAAAILRGKHKPTFAPHADCGDHVIIINCAKAVLTGKKLENMLPNNTIGRSALTRLRVYKDANHKNAAQKPVAYEF